MGLGNICIGAFKRKPNGAGRGTNDDLGDDGFGEDEIRTDMTSWSCCNQISYSGFGLPLSSVGFGGG